MFSRLGFCYEPPLKDDGGKPIVFAKNFEMYRNVKICVNRYRGALAKVYMDGAEIGIIAYPPYLITIKNVCCGEHLFEFELFGTRINTFGSLHNCGDNHSPEPITWETQGYEFSYEYVLKPTGIISAPIIEIIKCKKSG